MRNIYFDLCSIPIYLLILATCFLRKMTRGRANRTFILLNFAALLCAVTDIWMEYAVNPVPLSPGSVLLGNVISFVYLLVRNSMLVIYLIFIFHITRTDYRIRPFKKRLMIWLPYGLLEILLIQNIFTHNVFSVTEAQGYSRGPLMTAFYLAALLYGVLGTIYCFFCKKFLTFGKWASLISVYALTFAAVFVQLLIPHLLVEMFSTAIGLLMIMLLVMRPEETMDYTVGVQSWEAYQTDIKNVLLSGESVELAVLRMTNAAELRSYMGEDAYSAYAAVVAEEIRQLYNQEQLRAEMYFERPGTFYLICDEKEETIENTIPRMRQRVLKRLETYADRGVRFDPKICLIRCPEDLKEYRDIINLGHKFPQLGPHDQTVLKARDVVHSRTFEIINNMEEILNRGLRDKKVEIYYQPIYNIKTGRFDSAEALARLNDEKYGIISPGIFIPAAENLGLILPIGEMVIDSVFRFISTHDLQSLGLSYVEINLSVAQCLQSDLTDIIRDYQKKYKVSPSQVTFEITETLFDNISHVMEKNIRDLTEMGYRFSLDDYGIGYSNIQRLSRLPVSMIKIDKSMVDEMFSTNGSIIIQNTVRMMQGIHKELVMEGVETQEEKDALIDMSCDFIQGFYYSKPLPEKEFIAFMRRNREEAS